MQLLKLIELRNLLETEVSHPVSIIVCSKLAPLKILTPHRNEPINLQSKSIVSFLSDTSLD